MHNAFDAQQQSLPPPDPRVVLHQAVRTWKNVFLLLLLAIALMSLVAVQAGDEAHQGDCEE